MATVSTRQIGHTADRKDRVAIKQDGEALLSLIGNKWGVLEVVVSSVTWTCGDSLQSMNAGTLDLRAAGYNDDCDTPILNQYAMTANQGTATLGSQTAYVFSVNNGVVGPAAVYQGDNTWDLLVLEVELPEGNTIDNFQATVTYTLTFTDLTPAVLATGNATVTVAVDQTKPLGRAAITQSPGTFGTNNGRVELKFVSLTTTSGEQHKTGVPPLFTLASAVTPCDTAMQGPLIQHWATANSGVKTYPLRSYMIYAINNGKVDANGSNFAGLVWFAGATLWKPWDRSRQQFKETVSAVLSYNYSFTAM